MKTFMFCLLTIVSVIEFGCSTPEPTKKSSRRNIIDTIDVSTLPMEKDKTIALSDIADSVSYMRLSGEVMLGAVDGVLPASNGELLVFSGETVFRYDSSGTFINQLFQGGRGPKEVICYEPPILNATQNYILANDNWGLNYKKYALDGSFLGTEPKKDDSMRVVVVAYLDSLKVLYRKKEVTQTDRHNPFGANLMEVRNIYNDSLVYNYENPYKNKRYKVSGRFVYEGPDVRSGTLSDGAYWFWIRDMDTVYTTADFKQIIPRFVIQPKEPDRDFWSSIEFREGTATKEGVGTYTLVDVLPTDRFLFGIFSYTTGDVLAYNFCFDTQTEQLLGFENKIINDIDQSVDLDRLWKWAYHKNKLYIPVDAYKLKEGKGAARFADLTDDSNPVVMVVHLKQ